MSDTLRQSGVDSLLAGCARQWALQEATGDRTHTPPTLVGTAYHAAVETTELLRADGKTPLSESQFGEVAQQTFSDELPAVFTKSWQGRSEQHHRDELDAACHHFFHTADETTGLTPRETLEDLQPVALERHVHAVYIDDAAPMSGTIDALYEDADGRYILVDHKTAGSFSGYKPEHKWPQAVHYAVLAVLDETLPPTDLADVAFRYLAVRKRLGKSKQFKGFKDIEIPLDLDAARRLADRLRAAQHVIDDGRFLPDPSWRLCAPEWCPYFTGCRITGELGGPWTQVRQHLDLKEDQ